MAAGWLETLIAWLKAKAEIFSKKIWKGSNVQSKFKQLHHLSFYWLRRLQDHNSHKPNIQWQEIMQMHKWKHVPTAVKKSKESARRQSMVLGATMPFQMRELIRERLFDMSFVGWPEFRASHPIHHVNLRASQLSISIETQNQHLLSW